MSHICFNHIYIFFMYLSHLNVFLYVSLIIVIMYQFTKNLSAPISVYSCIYFVTAMPLVLLGCLLVLFVLQMPSRRGSGVVSCWEDLVPVFPAL